ncbi:DDE_3 domain-containing protein [Trichonephila clavipes]|nr:DDE_3 domain-containing protein [Trichonephila clavipes]
MTSGHHLNEELGLANYWEARGREQSLIEMPRFAINRLWQQFLNTDSAFRRFIMSAGQVINGGFFLLRISSGLAPRKQCVCVWGGISLGEFTDLHVFSRRNVNAYTTKDDILDAYVGTIGDASVQHEINARPRRARIVYAYLEQDTIQRIQWPARPPDLNLVEYVWDALERRVAALNLPPRTLATLSSALKEQ